jgi:hypothetical protein
MANIQNLSGISSCSNFPYIRHSKVEEFNKLRSSFNDLISMSGKKQIIENKII